jgi:hypothetical protein
MIGEDISEEMDIFNVKENAENFMQIEKSKNFKHIVIFQKIFKIQINC